MGYSSSAFRLCLFVFFTFALVSSARLNLVFPVLDVCQPHLLAGDVVVFT
ncbi:unnamed protein product [Arabis nemorensis]|uniref:Uncharacterized protein n=1 Tax=Arabis nemorensis TaxID=586526 RepID=A0A565ALN7_9BRAS|nr:unnamed protein product [Arabis nemorensis]